MGLGSFRWRILLIIITILLLWHSPKVWLIFMQEKSSPQAQLQENQMITSLSQRTDWTKEKVHLVVYYEALCPDSRSFFVKQLLPTYQKISENVEVKFVPYGKAMTANTDHGHEFTCQHGPIECQANIIHACSIDTIRNSSILLEYLSCMIRNNIEPLSIMESCAKKINVDRDSILKCYSGSRGKALLFKYGEITNSLTPKVSFIPTITLNNDSRNQARILKNLLQEVCLRFKIIPEGCRS